MIVDSCLFHNEIDMLEFRIKVLWDYVDKFIVVEADKTHSGKDKQLNFLLTKDKFEWAKEKIIHVTIHTNVDGLNLNYKPSEFDPNAPQWKIENQQRNAIINACDSFSDNDILMLSDVDEIPSLEAVKFRKENNLMYPFTCDQFVIPYGLDYYRPDIGWRGTVMCDMRYAKDIGTQELRNNRQNFSPFSKGGYHLTYFGGAERIKNKLESFAHQELNFPEFTDLEYIRECIKNGEGISKIDNGQPLKKTWPSFYPDYIVNNAPKKWWINKERNYDDNY